MSEPAANSLQLNAVWYQILKPGPIKDAQGNTSYAVVGMHPDLQSATLQAAKTPGCAIVMSTVLFITPDVLRPQ